MDNPTTQAHKAKAVLLIEVVETYKNNEPEYNLMLSQDGLAILRQYSDYKIAPLTICGPYRTGKSFLANRLLQQMDGFQIGSTVNAQTKGIWIWSEPQVFKLQNQLTKQYEDFYCFFMDCEGSNSSERGSQLDQMLMTLLILLSSTMIYNTVGVIEERALDNLAALIQIAEQVHQNNKGQGQNIKEDFPYFIWTLRDFTLDLGVGTAEDYLENCLADVPFEQELIEKSQMMIQQNEKQEQINQYNIELMQAIQQKNQMRQKIRKFFPKRTCYTLCRPVFNESDLRNLANKQYSDLRPEFQDEMDEMIRSISLNINPKQLNRSYLSCGVFINYTIDIIERLNNKRDLMMGDVQERVFAYETKQITKEIIKNIDSQFFQKQYENLPEDPQLLRKQYSRQVESAVIEFKQRTSDFSLKSQVKDNCLRMLLEDIEGKMENLEQQNSTASKIQADQLIQNFMSNYKLPSVQSLQGISGQLIDDLKAEVINYLEFFMKEAKGPLFMNEAIELIPDFIFQQTQLIFNKVIDVYDQEVSDFKVRLEERKQSEERLKQFMNEQQDVYLGFHKDQLEKKNENEKLNNELDRMQRLKNLEINQLKEQLDKLDESLTKKRSSKQALKIKVRDLDSEILRIGNKMNQQQKDFDFLQKKLSETEKLLQKYNNQLTSYRLQENSGLQMQSSLQTLQKTGTPQQQRNADVYEALILLSRNIEELNMGVQNYNLNKINRLKEKLIEKDREIGQIKDNRDKTFKQLRNDYQQKMELYKKQLGSTVLDLEKKLQSEFERVNKLKGENASKMILERENKQKSVLNSNMEERIKILEETVNFKDKKQEVLTKTIQQFMLQVEKAQKDLAKNEYERNQYKSKFLESKNDVINVIQVVNLVTTRKKEKAQAQTMIQKLSQNTVQELKPFFTEFKIKAN